MTYANLTKTACHYTKPHSNTLLFILVIENMMIKNRFYYDVF